MAKNNSSNFDALDKNLDNIIKSIELGQIKGSGLNI